MSNEKMIKRVFAIKTPCEKYACASKDACAKKLLACSSFKKFIEKGRAIAPTEPSRKTYLEIFRLDDTQ